ncbi:MAG TPA: hypothetical protein VJ851_10330 [Jatrophihabitans sp.]|nr:hypothetical protein [Jatrophihabitans sp.]
MSSLSDYLNAHLPEGWQKPQLVDALNGRLDRATVYKYLAGSHPQNPHDSVLQEFASVLPGVTVVDLRAAANQPVGVEQPWVPPIEANRLTLPQRRALEAFIKATVAASELLPADPRPRPMPVAAVLAGPTAPAPQPTTEELIPVSAVTGQLSADERAEVQSYIDQLTASGRADLAEMVAASLVISSASETASSSSRD